MFYYLLQIEKFINLGGNNIVECVKRIMNYILSNELACQTNLTGFNGNLKFGGNIIDLIFGKFWKKILMCNYTNELLFLNHIKQMFYNKTMAWWPAGC